jgi:hypothetical protein
MMGAVLIAVAIGAFFFGLGYVAGRFGIIDMPDEPSA